MRLKNVDAHLVGFMYEILMPAGGLRGFSIGFARQIDDCAREYFDEKIFNGEFYVRIS